MSEDRIVEYLGHMLEAAQLAMSYVAGIDREDFLADKRTQQAVILNIVVIGEAANKIVKDYADFVERHPDIPWKNMKGMRNRIAHGYFDINLEIVWSTTQTALPNLIDRLTSIHDRE